jgi:hypothetical protein
MSDLAIAVANMPGTPISSLVINLAPALAPVGMALFVLVVFGAIVLLLGRDAHDRAAPGCRGAARAGGELGPEPTDPKSLRPLHGSAS